jgi:bifunctional non-homologous end joining protein LigD
MRLITRSGYD